MADPSSALHVPRDSVSLAHGTLPLLGFGIWQIKGADAADATTVALQSGYRHLKANHNRGQYASKAGGGVNALEGFWVHLKRGINGTHIHVSGKHLPKYLGEFEYRWNMRQAPHLMLDRMMYSFAR